MRCARATVFAAVLVLYAPVDQSAATNSPLRSDPLGVAYFQTAQIAGRFEF